MRASSHAYVYIRISRARAHSRVSSTTRGVVTLYWRDIEPWRSSSPQIRPEYLKEDGPIARAILYRKNIYEGDLGVIGAA